MRSWWRRRWVTRQITNNLDVPGNVEVVRRPGAWAWRFSASGVPWFIMITDENLAGPWDALRHAVTLEIRSIERARAGAR
jgi:hypothetical protein